MNDLRTAEALTVGLFASPKQITTGYSDKEKFTGFFIASTTATVTFEKDTALALDSATNVTSVTLDKGLYPFSGRNMTITGDAILSLR